MSIFSILPALPVYTTCPTTAFVCIYHSSCDILSNILSLSLLWSTHVRTMSSSYHYQGMRATHWSTNLFFDTGDYPAFKDESASEFEDWRVTNTIFAMIHSLANIAFLFGCVVGVPVKTVFDVLLSCIISWPGAMYAGWMDPSHGQIIGLIVITMIQLAIWTDFFVRTVMTDRWLVWCVATVFLLFTIANFLRMVRWYLRRFLSLDMYGMNHQVHLEPGEDASPDEDTLCDEDALLEPYSDGLLGLAYRDQQEGTRQETGSSHQDEPNENDVNEDDVLSQLQHRDCNRDSSSAPAVGLQSRVLIDVREDGPSTIPTRNPPQSEQNPSPPSRQGPRFKQLSFQPRFRWQEKVPDHFRRGLVAISLGFGMFYLIFEAGSLYMGYHYCKMDLKM